jgi:tetratricopeptide (TPR) repeat protein
MVSYAQGVMPDAYAMFRMGQDINEIAERGARGTRWCQSELNLAGVHIDSANLPRARFHLENALRGTQRLGDEDMMARVLGYLGLLNHLSGNYGEAHTLYRDAIEQLRSQGNRRGLSIFLRHLADLYRKERRYDEARPRIAESIVIAESGGHLDLVQYARVAEAHLGVLMGDVTARQVLEPALRFARIAGIPKLEADVLTVQAQIALENRDTELAARLAIRSLGIAGSCGMRLRMTSSLVLMGRVAGVRGDWEAARSILRAAIELGHEQGYQLQVEGADRELIRIDSWHRGRVQAQRDSQGQTALPTAG